MCIKNKRKPGFSLVELLVAMVISGILVGLTTSVYSLFRRSLSRDQGTADISQNARIVFDRLSREIRQSPDMSTELPADPSDNTVTQPYAVEFENGHATDLTYRHYFVQNSVLELEQKEYYCLHEPSVRVRNVPASCSVSDPITANVLSTTDIADHVQSIAFYGDRVIEAVIITADGNGQTYTLRSFIYRRN
jgi:prepilin-type N-terminal cleavage/methylation domain-containing protein